MVFTFRSPRIRSSLRRIMELHSHLVPVKHNAALRPPFHSMVSPESTHCEIPVVTSNCKRIGTPPPNSRLAQKAFFCLVCRSFQAPCSASSQARSPLPSANCSSSRVGHINELCNQDHCPIQVYAPKPEDEPLFSFAFACNYFTRI
jgi:hypothetical protein